MKKPIKKSSKKFLILLAIIALIGGAVWYFKSQMQSAQVALIDNGGVSAAVCTSNIASFTTTGSCGGEMVERVDYTCTTDGKKGYEGGNGNCVSAITAYDHAKTFCGQTCQTPAPTPLTCSCPPGAMCKLDPRCNPTPTPSTRPTPESTSRPPMTPVPSGSAIPTPRACSNEAGMCVSQGGKCLVYKDGCQKQDLCASPFKACGEETNYPPSSSRPSPSIPPIETSPLISCVTEAYKLPGKELNYRTGLAQESVNYKVPSGKIVVTGGETFVVNMLMTNMKSNDIRSDAKGVVVQTQNSLAGSAPYRVTSIGPSCTEDEKNRSFSCLLSNFLLRNRKEVRPDTMGKITADRVVKPVTSTLSYTGVFNGQTFTCSPVTITVNPTYRQSCYGWGRYKWCRNVIVR